LVQVTFLQVDYIVLVPILLLDLKRELVKVPFLFIASVAKYAIRFPPLVGRAGAADTSRVSVEAYRGYL